MATEASNLWDYAANLHRQKQRERERQCVECTMFFVGSRQAGKTSIIYKFLERSDHPKPSVALEYFFGRRSVFGSSSDLCHIYELAGGSAFAPMVGIPITARSLMSLVIILVLDLSAPEDLVSTMDSLLSAIRDRIEEVVKQSEAASTRSATATAISINHPSTDSTSTTGLATSVRAAALARIGEGHQDIRIMDIFPVPLLILGTKYDIFRDFEPEHKKILCRCLRFLAHAHGASLQFVSQNTPDVFSTRVQTILKKGPNSKDKPNVDYNTALNIAFGEDSFEDIGIFDVPDRASLEVAKKACRELMRKSFGKKDTNGSIEDPGKDPNFKEYQIDVVLAQKMRELELENSSRNLQNLDLADI